MLEISQKIDEKIELNCCPMQKNLRKSSDCRRQPAQAFIERLSSYLSWQATVNLSQRFFYNRFCIKVLIMRYDLLLLILFLKSSKTLSQYTQSLKDKSLKLLCFIIAFFFFFSFSYISLLAGSEKFNQFALQPLEQLSNARSSISHRCPASIMSFLFPSMECQFMECIQKGRLQCAGLKAAEINFMEKG